MSSGQEIRQSLESSASTYTAGIDSAEVSGNTGKAFYSAVTSKKPVSPQTYQRLSISSADAGVWLDDSGYYNLAIHVGNSVHVALNATTSVAGQSITVFLALYAPGEEHLEYIGKTRDYTLVGDSYYKAGLGFVTATEIIDVGPATLVYPVVRVAPTSGTAAIAVEPM